MSKYNQKGQEIKNFKFPFQLIFSAPDNVKAMFPDNFQKDFTDQLITIPQGTVLFKVYAKAEPDTDKVLIGELHSNSPIIRSMYGDTKLFFEH